MEMRQRRLPQDTSYTGRELDTDTGLYYYRNRWYDSEIGKFISEDPIGFAGGINGYGYVGNNPVGFSDSLGLYPDGPVNALRDPVAHDSYWNFGGITNGLSNTVSDVLGLDDIAAAAYTLGNHRCSTSDRLKAASNLGFSIADNVSGGGKVIGLASKVIDKGLKGLSKLAKRFRKGPKSTKGTKLLPNQRESLLSSATDPKLRRRLDALYRKNAKIGNGSTADAIRYELRTGKLLSPRGHFQKGIEMRNGLLKDLKSGRLNSTDTKIARDLAKDLQNALSGQ